MQREIASSREHPYVLYSQSYYGTYVPTLKGPWEKEKDEGNVFPPPFPTFKGVIELRHYISRQQQQTCALKRVMERYSSPWKKEGGAIGTVTKLSMCSAGSDSNLNSILIF